MCYKCGNPITQQRVARGDTCPTCHADLHACRNCSFYSPGSHWDCAETVSEPCFDKEKANFCDSFRVRRTFGGSDGTDLAAKQEAARKAFDALFS